LGIKSKKPLFAIQLKDEFTPPKPIIGKPKVNLIGNKEKAVKNNSGLYCFGGSASGTHSIAVQARYYCGRIVEVDTLTLDPKLPVVDVSMAPNLNYPFPKKTTLVRGMVRTKGDNDSIVLGARVVVSKSDKEFFTDERGRFIFYFNEEKEDEEEEQIIKLVITKPGFKKKIKSCILKKEETCFVEIFLQPER
jgi:hypothetical protein